MAVGSVVAKRYSRALWELAKNKETASAWKAPLAILVQAMTTSPELSELLKSPVFSIKDKWAVVSELARKAGADKALTEYLRFITEAGRVEALPLIVEEFNARLLEAENTLNATIETALALNDSQLREITSMLEKIASKKVVPTVIEKPELIAGIRVQILGKTLDASLASSLEHMQRQLLSATESTPIVAQA